MKKLAVLAVLAVLRLGNPESRHGYAQSDFYKGKTITVVQIVDAGGTGDLRRKALFPFLQKYIPGNPTIVSDYMPGGGGRKATNHVYRVARAGRLDHRRRVVFTGDQRDTRHQRGAVRYR